MFRSSRRSSSTPPIPFPTPYDNQWEIPNAEEGDSDDIDWRDEIIEKAMVTELEAVGWHSLQMTHGFVDTLVGGSHMTPNRRVRPVKLEQK